MAAALVCTGKCWVVAGSGQGQAGLSLGWAIPGGSPCPQAPGFAPTPSVKCFFLLRRERQSSKPHITCGHSACRPCEGTPGVKPQPSISTPDSEILFSIPGSLSNQHGLKPFPALPLISRVPTRALHPPQGLHLGQKTPTPLFPGLSLLREKLLSGAEETRRIAALLVSISERNWVLTVSTALGVTVAVVWGDTAPFRAAAGSRVLF